MPGASKTGGGLEVADEYKSAVAYTKQPFGEDATQPSSFQMRSGNATPFKLMGSSPFTWPKWLGGKGKTPAAAPQPKVAEAVQSAQQTMVEQQAGGEGNVPPHGPEAHLTTGGKPMAQAGGGGFGGVGMIAQGGAQPQKGGWGGVGAKMSSINAQNTPEQEGTQVRNPFDTQQSLSSLAGMV